MGEIRRSDSANIDYLADYLQKNGINPVDNKMPSLKNKQLKNVAGFYTDNMPAIVDNNIYLDIIDRR